MSTDLPLRVCLVSLHTSPLHQPGIRDAGGMNVYVLEQAKALARQGHDVTCVTRRDDPREPEVTEVDVPGATGRVRVRRIPMGPPSEVAKTDLPRHLDEAAAALADLADVRAADVLHAHYWLSGAAMLAARHVNRAATTCVTMHTLAAVKNAALAPGDQPEPAARVTAEREVLAACDVVFANTADEARDLGDLYGVASDRIRVVPPGVDLDLFTPMQGKDRAEWGLAGDGPMVLFVGRVQALKGPHVLLEAVARLVAADRAPAGVQMVVCGGSSGSGPVTVDTLAEQAAALGISDRVRFIDPMPRPALARLYNAADVVAVPSFHETFGLVAVEAQACGRPVVASAVGGLRTAVADGRSGLLVPGHDPGDWAAALARVLQDPVFARSLGRGGRAHAARFGWEAVARAVVAAYRDPQHGARKAVCA